MAPVGEVWVDGVKKTSALGTEVFEDLECLDIEREQSADTAAAVAEEEPEVAQGRRGGGYGGPHGHVTSRTVLGLRSFREGNPKLKGEGFMNIKRDSNTLCVCNIMANAVLYVNPCHIVLEFQNELVWWVQALLDVLATKIGTNIHICV